MKESGINKKQKGKISSKNTQKMRETNGESWYLKMHLFNLTQLYAQMFLEMPTCEVFRGKFIKT
jgi:hypothetical protein